MSGRSDPEQQIEIATLAGAHPLQAAGRLAGRPWYFRARHGEWSFWVGGEPDSDPLDADTDASGFYWVEPWAEGDALESEESRARELIAMGVEAERDDLAQLVCRLSKGATPPEWAESDKAVARAWTESPVWLAVAALAVRLAPEPRVVRQYLGEYGISAAEPVDGTPLYGTAYDLVRADESLYSASKHGVADERALRRKIADGLREHIEPPKASDVARLASATRRGFR